MVTKVNILFDGGFFEKKFLEKNPGKKHMTANDVMAEVQEIMDCLKQKTNGETQDILFRVFYYDCAPFSGTIKNYTGKNNDINFSESQTYKVKKQLLSQLCLLDKFAVRLGELSFDGWKQDLHNKKWKPDFHQKGVDMKIGLDMALMAMKHTADKVVLVAGDSDFIAPIKFVRTEGLQVYLYSMGHKIKSKLKEHCDFILS